MRRVDTLERYRVSEDGYILTPGTFYQERLYIPHFWSRLNASRKRLVERDQHGVEWYIVRVTKADHAEYPELGNIASLGLREEGGKVLSWSRGSSYVPTVLIQ